jgi:hypothetical protein
LNHCTAQTLTDIMLAPCLTLCHKTVFRTASN